MDYAQVVKNLIIYVLLATPSFVLASSTSGIFKAASPYAGVEAIQTNQNYKNGFGKGVFQKNPQDYNVFAGFNFSHYFGIEAGYEFQPKRSKNVVLTAGQTPPGADGDILPNGSSLTYTSDIRGYHPYIGLFAEFDQCYVWLGKIKYQALIGASFSTIKARDSIIEADGVPENDPVIENYSKQKTVLLAKLMIGHNFTENFGFRISCQYRNLSAFKINSSSSNSTLKLKDTLGVGIGLTYYFCKY